MRVALFFEAYGSRVSIPRNNVTVSLFPKLFVNVANDRTVVQEDFIDQIEDDNSMDVVIDRFNPDQEYTNIDTLKNIFSR